jgi:hypothetical protein
MKAERLIRERRVLEPGFTEAIVWRLPQPLSGSNHSLNYRPAYVVDGECVPRCDNEADKGDHRHMGTEEMPCVLVSVDQLLDDFSADVATWKGD